MMAQFLIRDDTTPAADPLASRLPGSRIEPVGILDFSCLVAELVLVAMLVALLPPNWRRGGSD